MSRQFVTNHHERDKMDNLERKRRIQTFLMELDGFDEIDSKAAHRIIYDVMGRWEQGGALWFNLYDFVGNYHEWLKKYIKVEGSDPYAMWEKWSEMLKDLYLP